MLLLSLYQGLEAVTIHYEPYLEKANTLQNISPFEISPIQYQNKKNYPHTLASIPILIFIFLNLGSSFNYYSNQRQWSSPNTSKFTSPNFNTKQYKALLFTFSNFISDIVTFRSQLFTPVQSIVFLTASSHCEFQKKNRVWSRERSL